ncbi:MAG TPA: hypothetical protein VD994_08735 [Prosthecobacter sp.]|nr:hypothetical protein [Prosthecobacter sp.]
MSAAAAPLTTFILKNGVVESGAEQALVDAFAADFQGLRHFGSRLGEALELGSPWSGVLREDDFTLGYGYFGEGTGAEDPGAGALVGKQIPLYDMLTTFTTHED